MKCGVTECKSKPQELEVVSGSACVVSSDCVCVGGGGGGWWVGGCVYWYCLAEMCIHCLYFTPNVSLCSQLAVT